MDIANYIQSGAIESYVLGTSSKQDSQAVECLSHIYPEVKQEVLALQTSIEKLALANAKPTPLHLKNKVLAAIDAIEQDMPTSVGKEKLKVVHNSNETTSKLVAEKGGISSSLVMKLSFAASIAMLITVFAYNSSKTSTLKQDAEVLKTTLASLESQQKEQDYINFILAHSATQKVAMPGTENNPESEVRVYWNTATKGVFLKVDKLPEPTSDKQYQLWAIVDGAPKDMGVFDIDPTSEKVQQMPIEVENAQAFAITLEEKGGSLEPTLSAMYVVGNV